MTYKSPRCPHCNRRTPLTNLGLFKKHRPVADSWVGPYCPGSGEKAPS